MGLLLLKNTPDGVFLFLCFLEGDVLAELCAIFLELNLPCDELLVFASPVDLSGRLVAQLYKIIL